MLKYNENLAMSWEEALDDGSMTLAAELLVLALPDELKPVYTCVHFPSIINNVARISLGAKLDRETTLLLLKNAKGNLSLLAEQNAISAQEVASELDQMITWLSNEVTPTDKLMNNVEDASTQQAVV